MPSKSLLVGIGDYPGRSSDLDSASGDLKFWEEIFVRSCGVSSDQMRILKDGDATRAALETAWTWLQEDDEPLTRRYFFFSGHGDRRRTNGGPAQGVLLLHDGVWTAPVSKPKAANSNPLVCILDCCYSGGFGSQPLENPPLGYQAKSGGGENSAIGAAGESSQLAAIPEDCIAFSACGPGQVAMAGFPGSQGLSAFSYVLNQVYRHAKHLAFPLNLLCQTARDRLSHLGYRQRPELRAPLSGAWETKAMLSKGPV